MSVDLDFVIDVSLHLQRKREIVEILTRNGFGILVAALSVTYRDVQQIVPYALQVGMFLSPVVYPVELFPERWRWLLSLNPLTGLIGGFRAAFFSR